MTLWYRTDEDTVFKLQHTEQMTSRKTAVLQTTQHAVEMRGFSKYGGMSWRYGQRYILYKTVRMAQGA